MNYEELAEFIDKRMRMAHVYQPVMLMTLLDNDGRATEEEIARVLLSYDLAQIEYYEIITRNMVGRVLRKHGIVKRDQKTKRYDLEGFERLTTHQIEALRGRCEARLRDFLQARGDAPWRHRKMSSGYVSGTRRYEVLKAAKFRCELCGISAEDKALEVDHIIPRSKGGSDDISNLQALCYSCNAMKQDRDDTDFRAVRASYEKRHQGCIFCSMPEEHYVVENELAYAVADKFPVTDGHMLVIAKRHVPDLFGLGRPEINACNRLFAELRSRKLAEDPSITGFNIGTNAGKVAGQTIEHFHWHLIPRRAGDVEDPVGGVRNTIPGKGNYL